MSLHISCMRLSVARAKCNGSAIVSWASDQYANCTATLDVYGLFARLGSAVFERGRLSAKDVVNQR